MRLSVTRGYVTAGWCWRFAFAAAFPWLTVCAAADSAAGRTVWTLEMRMTNPAMTTSTAVVTTVSSQSIPRWRRRRLRRRAVTRASRASRTSEFQPGEGVPMTPG